LTQPSISCAFVTTMPKGVAPAGSAAGEDDANVNDSRHAAELLRAKDIAVRFDVWQGWAHDWPYWKEMLHRYV